MAKYHISDSGEVVVCRARKNPCPRQNFNTVEAAEEAKEAMFADGTFNNPLRKPNKAVQSAEKFYGGKFITSYSIELQKGVESVLQALQSVGNPLIVGGAVRDSFNGSENKDIDIEVHGTTIDKLSEFLKKEGYRVDEVGKAFGVLKVSKKGVVDDLDVSVPRKENRVGAGHRSFEVEMDEEMTVQEAAERRDFTFNAVMYDHARKVLVDPAHGKKDFENNVMRHVSEKFAEDPLRVLRGFQFAGRFNMTYAPETAELCRNLLPEYKHLSVERVQEEWDKFYAKSSNHVKGAEALIDSGWDKTEQGLSESLNNGNVWNALSKLSKIEKEKRVVLGSASIAWGMTDKKDRENFIQKTVIGVKEQNLSLVYANFNSQDFHDSFSRKKAARELAKTGFNFEDYKKFATLVKDRDGVAVALAAISEGVGETPEREFVMGRDVLAITDRKAGPWMGKLLTEILDKQYRGEFKNREEAIEYMKKRV